MLRMVWSLIVFLSIAWLRMAVFAPRGTSLLVKTAGAPKCVHSAMEIGHEECVDFFWGGGMCIMN